MEVCDGGNDLVAKACVQRRGWCRRWVFEMMGVSLDLGEREGLRITLYIRSEL